MLTRNNITQRIWRKGRELLYLNSFGRMKANGWLRVCREEAMDLAQKMKNVEEFEPSRFKRLSPVPKARLDKRLVSAESYLIARWTWLLLFGSSFDPTRLQAGRCFASLAHLRIDSLGKRSLCIVCHSYSFNQWFSQRILSSSSRNFRQNIEASDLCWLTKALRKKLMKVDSK